MTSVEYVRSTIASSDSAVRIAGVPWPLYKLVALGVGLVVLATVAVAAGSAAAAVLAAAASTAAVWAALAGLSHQSRD